MDDFFDRLKEHASTAKDGAVKIGRQVYARTNNVLNQTKLNFSINDSESKVNDIYSKIGKAVYEDYLKEGCVEETFYDDCVKIDELFAEIENMREKVAELKNSVKCKSCGAYNKENAKYCSKCGEKLDGQTAQEGENVFEEAAEDVGEAVSDAADAAAEAVSEVKEAVEETAENYSGEAEDADTVKAVRRVVTIKAKRPQDSEQ